MTKLALYEKYQRRQGMEINLSSRRDYLWRCVLLSVLCYTAAMAITLGVAFLCLLVQKGAWSTEQLLLAGILILVVYLAGAVLFGLGSYIRADARYEQSEEGMHRYETMLKRLKWIYEKEERK